MKKILDRDAPVLREMAKEVPEREIASPKIKKIIKEMREALASQEDGVAIAAPQIGYSLRIFVVSHKYLPGYKKSEIERNNLDLVCINPVITKISKEKKEMEEGCLSVRYLYGKVLRSQKATIIAYNENGEKFMKGASGLLAQIFQHETDHLHGILFTDKAKNVEEIIPEHLKQ
jgi:peptide deformylase